MHVFQVSGVPTRLLSSLLSLALALPAVLAVGVVGAPPAAAADAVIQLAKEGPTQVLVGDTATYTLTATNPTGVDQVAQYNLSFRDVLPPGVVYAGPTTPTSAGAPVIYTNRLVANDPKTEYQTLVWSNVADLQVNSSAGISFVVRAEKDPLPVASTFTNKADAYTNSDPRRVPRFDSRGVVLPNPTPPATPNYTASASAATGSIGVTAFTIDKSSSPNPEGELLRGVHDHVATYTLTVTNNPSFATDDIEIRDYLPAGLEFLGCGTVDNSTNTFRYPNAREYPTAPSLSATPAVPGCLVPTSVETVVGPLTDEGRTIPEGVFTKVTWQLGDLSASGSGRVKSITYRAGIPQRANTTDWQATLPATGTVAAPPILGGGTVGTQPRQTANLDNNTGPSTRETGTELLLTNVAVGDGLYTGPVENQPGAGPYPVASSTEHKVTAEDLEMQKAVQPETFVTGEIATYTLTLMTSEYVTATGIEVTDVMPNGVCPLWSTATPTILGSLPLPLDCGTAPPAGSDPTGATLASVERKADGTFTLVFAPITAGANGTITITYQGRMRTAYIGGSLEGQPTSSGDTFTNNVRLAGLTSSRPGVNAPPNPGGLADPIAVADNSSATQSSTQPVIDKRIKPNVSGAVGYQCAAGTTASNPAGSTPGSPVTVPGAAEYVNPPAPPLTGADIDRFTFRNGSIACFLLRVEFPGQSQTKNPVVTDFLPGGTSYYPGSAVVTANSTLSDTDVGFTTPADPTGPLVWNVGVTSGGNRFAPKGAVFEVVFAVSIDGAASGSAPDVVGNLMKFRSENSAGQAISLRDQLDFQVAPLPPVSLVKGIASITSAVGGAVQSINNPPAAPTNVDGRTVRDGDVVRFRIDVTNTSNTLGPAFASSVRTVDVWDLLPAGVPCSNASNPVPPNGPPAVVFRCLNPGEIGYPASITTNRSLLRWQFDSSDTQSIAAGARKTITYDFTVPDGVSVAAILTDDAGVRSYQAFTNLPNGTATYYPIDNIDPSVPLADRDAPRASDPSNVVVQNVVLGKTGTTSVTEDNNNTNGTSTPPPAVPPQATIGEVVTYTVTATVRYGTSVYQGVVTDTLPSGLAYLSGASEISTDGGTTWSSALPTGTVLANSGQLVTLTLPTSYTDAANATRDHIFRVSISTRVTKDPGNAHGVTRNNIVRFQSKSSAAPGAPNVTTPPQRNWAVTIVEPSPTIVKSTTGDLSGTVVGGQKVGFTLTLSNLAGRPPLHDSWVIDCVPAGLNAPTYTTTTPAGLATLPPEPGTGIPGVPGNGCPTGTTRLAWNAGLLLTGTPILLGYEVTVDVSATGGQTYTNVATVSGNSLAGPRIDPTVPGNAFGRTYGDSDSLTLTVVGAGSLKSVDKPNATIGEIVTYTIRAELPPNVNFYNLALIDSLQVGVAPEATGGRPTPVVSTQCTTLPSNAACSPDIVPTVLDPSPDPIAPAGNNTIGLGLGDLGPSTSLRQVTVTYTARVVDVSTNTTGKDLVNSVVVRWDLANANPGNPSADDPTSVNRPGGWSQTSQPRTATVNVTQPSLTPTKTVSDTTVEPGQVWTYTVVVTNASGLDASAAYDATITDSVPSGVVVDPASLIASGGVLTGTEAYGSGGTITWTVPGPIARGDSVTFTYSATLAPSPTIDATPQTNTAEIGTYYSLPEDYPPGFPDATNGGPRDRREYNGPSTTSTLSPLFPALTAAKTTPSGEIAYIGAEFPWRFEVTNSGGAGAFDVDLIDTLPPSWRFVPGSASVAFPGVPVSTSDPALYLVGDVQTLTWTDKGDLAAGQKAIVTFRATPLEAAVGPPPTPNPIGSAKAHTNSVQATADDATGAPRNLTGPYESNTATATARIHAADVAIDKTAGDFVAGSTGSFTLTVRNLGPDPAVGPFVVTDPLPATPAGLAFVSATGTGWTCSLLPAAGTPGTVRCVRTNAADTLATSDPAAQFPPIVITVAVDADVPNETEYPNTAEVDAVTFDPNLGNNRDDATGVVRTEADLEIVKALSGPLVAGRDATYTLDVRNLGPSVSRAEIVVEDTLPPGATFRSAAGDGWGCIQAAGVVTCTRDTDLAVGQAAGQITLVIGIPSSQTADVTNVATVESATTPELTTSNNTSTVSTKVTREADLAIEKRHVGLFVAGAKGTYEFQVVNKGPSDAAADVKITDTLPSGLTYDSVTSTAGGWGCTAAGQVLTCVRGGANPTTMPTGANETLTVLVNIASNLPIGPISNTATVSSPTEDPVIGNNTDPDETGTETLADLQVVKTAVQNPVTAGETVTYTLAVTNNGPSVARQLITVTDVIPTGLSWPGPGSATGTGWTCSYADADRTVTCQRLSDLAAAPDPGSVAPVITLVLDVDPDAGPATIRNSATVKSPTNDPNIDNNTDIEDVRVVDEAEISLAKERVGSGDVTAGTDVEFTVTVTNEGPSDADSIIVVDTLEAGLVPVSASGDGWDCSVSGLTYLCTRPVAPASADGTPRPAPPITITATVGASVPNGTTLVNTATVSTSTPGDDVANNTGTADVPVVAIADLVLTKTVRPLPDGETLDAGEQLTYDLLVTNAWKSDAVAPITVIDTLPAGFTYAGTAGTGWYCKHVPGAGSPAGDVVTCILGEHADPDPRQDPLPAGATAPLLSLLVSIDPTVTEGTYSNNAEVSTRTTEVTLDNNGDSVPVDVGEQADLWITKEHTGVARVGDQLTFTLAVFNAGPSVARNVVVTDELPKGLTFVSAEGATTDAWTCSEDASVVTCELAGELAIQPRDDREPLADRITLLVKVGPQAYPSVVNPAEVDSATFDPNKANNKATDTVDVPALVDLEVTKSHTGTFQVGQGATYTFVVTNNGPTPAPGVVITDTLPAGLTYVSATGSGVTCAAVGQVVTCTAADSLGVDKSLTISLSVNVLPTAYPGVTNTVSVSSPSEETRTDNNTATDPAIVSPLVDLDIVKELIDQGDDRAVFEITVTNTGPNATSAPIVVVDDLPVGLELVGAQGSGWQCGVTEPVTCTYAASLPVGGQASFGVVATITAPAGATVTNVATVTAGCSPAPSGVQAASVRSSAVDCGSAEAELTVPPLDGDTGGSGDTGGAGDDDGDSQGLADTGARVGSVALLALALLVLGGAAVLSSRSRRQY